MTQLIHRTAIRVKAKAGRTIIDAVENTCVDAQMKLEWVTTLCVSPRPLRRAISYDRARDTHLFLFVGWQRSLYGPRECECERSMGGDGVDGAYGIWVNILIVARTS